MADRAARTGLAVDVSIDLAWEQGRATHRHTSELETAIYRIVQEALTNATKHGHASRAVVELTEADRGVDIRVRDDGNGFESAAQTEGFGLVGMRERAELLGGAVSIDSGLGRGATLTPSSRRTAAPVIQRLRAPPAEEIAYVLTVSGQTNVIEPRMVCTTA